MTTEPSDSQRAGGYWLRKGMREAVCLPTFLLMCAFVGFAGLAKENGITMLQALVMTSTIWALPACVVLIAAISNGATLVAAFIAVTLSSARMMPMAIALIPEMRTEKTRTWVLLCLSHFIAITAWVIALKRFKDVPKQYRTYYFGGLGGTITTVNQFVVLGVYLSANSFSPKVLGVLFFLTPVYFLTSLWGSAREVTGKIAMVTGLALGPFFYIYFPGFDLLATGFVGGTLAYIIGRFWRAKDGEGHCMTFDAIDTWWWPLVFILVAGWIATDVWRWIGVLLGNKIDETAEILVFIRSVATALVAAVIAQLIIFPSGALAETPVFLRIVAAAAGFSAYFFIGRSVGLGVLTALAVLSAGMILGL